MQKKKKKKKKKQQWMVIPSVCIRGIYSRSKYGMTETWILMQAVSQEYLII